MSDVGADAGQTVEPALRVPTTMVLAVAAVGTALIAIFGEDDSFSALTVIGALAGLVPWALLAGGVRIPTWLFAVAGIGASALIVIGDQTAGGLFPAMLVVVEVARTSPRWPLVVATVAAAIGLALGFAVMEGSPHESGVVYFVGGIAISALSGVMLRRQEALTAQIRAMQAQMVEHAAQSERTHIAREVHDIVAHSLTVVMLHLTAARRLLRTDPNRSDEALARAEAVGRSSLDSVRQMVGLLRTGADAETVPPPQPGLRDLDELVERSRAGGLEVTADVDAPDLAPAVQLVLYRVVQESLSNVVQHAPGASCRVMLRPTSLEVVNARPSAPPRGGTRGGLGLVGMAERVRATGGTFAAGPTPEGGWRVAVTLPADGTVE
jgi:signal transduction histidine kinase